MVYNTSYFTAACIFCVLVAAHLCAHTHSSLNEAELIKVRMKSTWILTTAWAKSNTMFTGLIPRECSCRLLQSAGKKTWSSTYCAYLECLFQDWHLWGTRFIKVHNCVSTKPSLRLQSSRDDFYNQTEFQKLSMQVILS